jgi:hypothetical protein
LFRASLTPVMVVVKSSLTVFSKFLNSKSFVLRINKPERRLITYDQHSFVTLLFKMEWVPFYW